jgi:tetratricopeptide (TPR) repeat protein
VEKGSYLRDTSGVTSWMGHYEVVTGYDDSKQVVIAQDSYLQPDLEVPYETFERGWRSFNFTYILIYSPDKEEQLKALLGPDWDETQNYRRAYELASYETVALSGIDQLFAWFNRGTNMVALQDYGGAAASFDEYFRLYASLDILEGERPWRMLWYQTGPYKAYYGVGNYYAVIDLATITLERMVNEPTLEESYYWRGRAKAAAGDTAGAIDDFRQALKWHPDWNLALAELTALGAQP